MKGGGGGTTPKANFLTLCLKRMKFTMYTAGHDKGCYAKFQLSRLFVKEATLAPAGGTPSLFKNYIVRKQIRY